jgi:sugar O-acyltransferase (sialic acid O-acetyltransferase NeuD family)
MKKALIGYGGHAKEVMVQMGLNLPCFVDDEFVTENTYPISDLNIQEYEVMVAVGDSKKRNEIVKRLPINTNYFSFIHPTALIMGSSIKIGKGSFIGVYSILTENIEIGSHAILNRSVHIGHDSSIGHFFSAMPGSIISGDVTIGDNVYLGTNSTVIEKIKINSNILIGANGVVVKDINEEGVYVGVPVKRIKSSAGKLSGIPPWRK